MSVDISANTPATDTGLHGFVFEELMDQTLRALVQPLASKGLTARILNEQQIREEFDEQSLNGVDHFFAVEGGQETILFLLQEKWKLVTNQREVSQFLDCCARILARMPDFSGKVIRLWVTRTAPTTNGEKSLHEGGAYVIQSSTSMPALAVQTAQVIAEMLGDRTLAAAAIAGAPSMLPDQEVAAAAIAPVKAALQEKRIPAGAAMSAKIKVCVVRRD